MPALLLGAVAATMAGPLLAGLASRSSHARHFVEGLVTVLVAGLSLLHLLPHAIRSGGMLAGGAALVGAFGPMLLDRLGPKRSIGVALALLGVHSALDGSALAIVQPDAGEALGLAILAHRLPVGVLVYARLSEQRGSKSGWIAVTLLALATVGGFAAGSEIVPPEWLEGLIEGLVAGALLHVLAREQGLARPLPAELLGGAIGLVLLIGFSIYG